MHTRSGITKGCMIPAEQESDVDATVRSVGVYHHLEAIEEGLGGGMGVKRSLKC